MHSLLSSYFQAGPKVVIGMISGTSADAVDAVAVEIIDKKMIYLTHSSKAIPSELRNLLFQLFEDKGSVRQVALANVQVGELFAETALELMRLNPGMKPNLLCSHGQTVAHLPESFASLQIGEGAILAARTGLLTVSDFRQADLALGGQGAPLVPYFDAWLLGSEEVPKLAINLGGIANITWIPEIGSAQQVVGWDTGPANSIMDALATKNSGAACDFNGELASQGEINIELLQRWLSLPYFQIQGPKSTGREQFGREWIDLIWAMDSPANLMRTALQLTVDSLAASVLPLAQSAKTGFETVVGGGGAHNPVLMRELKRSLAQLGSTSVTTFDSFGIPAQAREGAAFALFGHQTLLGQTSSLASVTGAKRNAIQGKLSFPS